MDAGKPEPADFIGSELEKARISRQVVALLTGGVEVLISR